MEAVKRSETTAEIGAVAGILSAGREGNWQALAWFLERKYSERWGRKERVLQELTGKDGAPLQVESKIDMSKLSDKELRVIAGLAEKIS